jgi:hypothetical protein
MTAASSPQSGVCDICAGTVYAPKGYLLSTSQVVGSPEFWQKYFIRDKRQFSLSGITTYEEFCQSPMPELIADQRTPWMVCDDCISMFAVDRQQAGEFAKQWWESGRTFQPPGSGPASRSAIKFHGV